MGSSPQSNPIVLPPPVVAIDLGTLISSVLANGSATSAKGSFTNERIAGIFWIRWSNISQLVGVVNICTIYNLKTSAQSIKFPNNVEKLCEFRDRSITYALMFLDLHTGCFLIAWLFNITWLGTRQRHCNAICVRKSEPSWCSRNSWRCCCIWSPLAGQGDWRKVPPRCSES